MADGGDLILGLDDRHSILFAFGVPAQMAIAQQGVDQTGGRGDGIPGSEGDAAKDGAQSRGLVARDEYLAFSQVHWRETVGVLLDQVVPGPLPGGLDDLVIHVDGAGLAAELVRKCLVHLVQRDFKEPGDDANIDHVADLFAPGRRDLELADSPPSPESRTR